MIPFSILDLAPIAEGSNASQSFKNTLDLAQHGERWGYNRYWLAEHPGMPGIASAATAVVIAHVAAGTKTIRVGAGGVMLPNHSPLVIAEQFGTLEALHPGRIDLGLGRAPGSDQTTARALRRDLQSDSDQFPQDVLELIDYMCDEPRQRVLSLMRGESLRMKPPVANMAGLWQPQEQQAVKNFFDMAVVGGPDTVRARLNAILEKTQADEMIFTCDMYDHAKRLHAFDIAAAARGEARAAA